MGNEVSPEGGAEPVTLRGDRPGGRVMEGLALGGRDWLVMDASRSCCLTTCMLERLLVYCCQGGLG